MLREATKTQICLKCVTEVCHYQY